jgi:hypothetical protein
MHLIKYNKVQALELHGKLFPECNSLFSEEDNQVIFTTPGNITLFFFLI